MRLLSAITFVLLSFQLNASHHSGVIIFKGHGTWHNSNGESSDYELIFEKRKQSENAKKLTTTIIYGNKRETHSIIVHHADHGMVAVTNEAGENIGWGYHYHMGGTKLCHLEITPSEGVHLEQTFHGGMDGFHSIGSMEDANGLRTTWKDHATRIYPHGH